MSLKYMALKNKYIIRFCLNSFFESGNATLQNLQKKTS